MICVLYLWLSDDLEQEPFFLFPFSLFPLGTPDLYWLTYIVSSHPINCCIANARKGVCSHPLLPPTLIGGLRDPLGPTHGKTRKVRRLPTLARDTPTSHFLHRSVTRDMIRHSNFPRAALISDRRSAHAILRNDTIRNQPSHFITKP